MTWRTCSTDEWNELLYLRYYKEQVYTALGPADDEINRDIAESYEGTLPKSIKEELEE